MKLVCMLLALCLTRSIHARAQEKGTWRAASKTARAITGDISLAPEKVSINFSSFPMAQIRALTPAELNAAFDTEAPANASGNLYRISIPAAKRFVGKNTICGSEDTQWLLTLVAGHDLQIAFFSGPKMPVLTAEGIAANTNLCGIYAYTR
jgi:hypothetical protein